MDNLSKTEERPIQEIAALRMRVDSQDEELHRLKREMEQLRNSYSGLYDFSPVAYFTLDARGAILRANPMSALLMGSDTDRIVHQPFSRLVFPEDHSILDFFYDKVKQGASKQRCSIRLVKQDGTQFTAQLEGIGYFDEAQQSENFLIAVLDYSTNKQMEQRINAVKEQWENIFDSMPDLVTILDAEHEIVWLNKAMASSLGVTRQEAIGSKCYQAVHGLKEPPAYCPHAKAMKDGQEHEAEIIESRLGGIFDVSVTPLIDAQNRLTGSIHIARDISARRGMEAQLIQSVQLYRNFFETSQDCVFITALDGEIVDFNDAGKDLLGFSLDDLPQGMNVRTMYANLEDREVHIRTISERGFCKDYPVDFRKTDGSVINTLVTTVCRKDQQGNIIGFQGTIRDITQIKRSQERLRESEEKYRLIFVNSPVGMIHFDAKGLITDCNQKLLDILGATKQQAIGFDLTTSPANKLVRDAAISALLGKVGTFEGEYTSVTGGKTIWGKIVYSPLTTPEGLVSGGMAIVDDLTERKLAEESLTASEERLRLITETISEVFWLANVETDATLYVSPAYEHVWGQSCESLYNNPRSFLDAIHEGDRERVVTNLEVKKSGKPFEIEYRIVRPDGILRWIWDRGFPVKDRCGKVSSYAGVGQDITQRKQAELALKQSQQMFSSILSTSPIGISVTEGRTIKWVNHTWAKMFGFTDEKECKGLEARTLYPSRDEYERVGRLLYSDLEPGKITETDTIFLRADGSQFFSHVRAQVFDDSGPEKVSIVAITDITERKRVEEDLRKANKLYGRIVNTIPGILYDYVLRKDGSDQFLWLAGRCTEILELDIARMLADIDSVWDLIHPDDVQRLRHDISTAIQEGNYFNSEARIITPSGKLKWIHLMSRPNPAPPGEPAVWTGFILDVTHRKLIEKELQKSEEKYRLLADNTHDAIWQLNLDLVFTYINPAVERITGYTPQEWLGTRLADHCDEENFVKMSQAAVTEISRGRDGSGFSVEAVILGKNKREVPVEIVGKAIFDENGSPAALQGVTRDITERKLAEEALKEREARLRSYFELPLVGLAITSLDKGWLEVNDALCSLLGYSRFELQDMSWAELTHPEDLAADLEQFERVLAGRIDAYAMEKRFVSKSGDIIWTILSVSCVRKPEGAVDYFIAVLQDITDRKKAEQERENLRSQLLQSQKMEAVGTLAAGIAHDFNNMLQGILGYSEMLLYEKREGEPGCAELQKIVTTSLEAKDLVQKIRLFSRKADIQPVAVDLNHQISELAKLLSHTLLKTIDVDVHLGEGLGTIKADPALMDQMVTNLAINANEAMPDGGTLTIETQSVILDDDSCKTHIGIKPGPHILLTISDTGRGMSQELMERIFDPFFSTKQRDFHRGTGLGLSIVKGIVDEHSGYITVESEVGKGTTFKIYFPILAVQQKLQVQIDTKTEVTTEAGETILLVEDEELVRDLVIRLLERFGYKVIAVPDGREAVEVYAKERENIALVILDIVMPRMDGKACLQELLKINPGVKVLISSGVAQDDRVKEVVDLGALGALLKPYSMKILKEKVRAVLDAEG